MAFEPGKYSKGSRAALNNQQTIPVRGEDPYDLKLYRFKAGDRIVRISNHQNQNNGTLVGRGGISFGTLTMGKTYKVLSRKLYTKKHSFMRNGKLVGPRLAIDCVMIKDDDGKIGMFGAMNFKLKGSR